MGDRKIDKLFRRYLRHGDVEALGTAFDLVAPELLRVARYLCRGEAEAEDAVQACFLTTLERARDHDRERRLLPWMLGILANHARAIYRGAARQPDPGRLAAEQPADPLEEAGQREFAGAVERAIELLPAGYRAALRLYLLRGMGSGEIAAELGLSAVNARVRLHRGLQKLRKALPAGFVAGAALLATTGRGLAAVRSEVLARAARRAGTSAIRTATAATTPLLGGLLVSQRLVWISLAVVLFGLGGYLGLRDLGPSPSALRTQETLAFSAPERPSAGPGLATESQEERAASRAARVAQPAASGEVRFSGMVSDSREPSRVLVGAQVWTRPAGAAQRVLRGATNARGSFSFFAPPEEESTVFIEAEGYAPFRAPVSQHAFERYWESHGRQVLDEGARISLGIIEMLPGVRLAGRASLEDGSPAIGAQLFLIWDGDQADAFLPMVEQAVGRSIAGGALELDGRVPAKQRAGEGNHLLVAVLDDRLGCARFAALAGRDSIEDLEIVLHAGRSLSVTVQDGEGRPIAMARVTTERRQAGSLQTRFHEDRSWHPVPMPAAIERFFVRTTDAQGVANFPALPILDRDGSVSRERVRLEIHAEAEGYVPGTTPALLEDGVGSVMAMTLKTARLLRLTGRVLDSAGEPLAGASVELRPSEIEVTSGEGGSWEIVPPPGSLLADLGSLIFRKPGLVAWRVGIREQDPEATEIDIGDVRLGAPTRVSGQVVDDLGRGVPGVRISITRSITRGGGAPHDSPALRSGAHGSFVCERVPEGELEMRVILIEENRDFVESRQPLSIRGGDEGVRYVLQRRPWNRGRVVAEITEARTGDPLDALRAGVRRAEGGAGRVLPGTEISAGRVTVENIEVGRYQLWVQVANHPLAAIGFEIEESESELLLRIPVEEAGSIRGQLLAQGAVEFPSALVELELETSCGSFDPILVHPDLSAVTAPRTPAATGGFHWQDLTPGRWRVFVRCGEETAGPVTVEVRPGGESELELRLEPGARLRIELGAGPPAQEGYSWVFVSTITAGGATRSMGYFVPPDGPLPGCDDRSLRVVLPCGRTEYEVRLDDMKSEPVARGVVELERGEEHRISLK